MVGDKQGHAACRIPLLQQRLWLVISMGMLPVEYLYSNKASVSVEFLGDHRTVTKFWLNLATLSFRDITGFKTVVSKELTMARFSSG